MKIKQLNENNIGILPNEKIDGYMHGDALYFEEAKHVTYKNLAFEIYTNIVKPNNIKHILELGSGAGSLSYFLNELAEDTCNIVTLDGNQETMSSPYIDKSTHFVVRTDREYNLVDEDNNNIIFDLVLSFEHFEHISPGEDFDIFINNIKRHINNKTLLLVTASLQGDHSTLYWHPNVQSRENWSLFLQDKGFVVHESSFVRHDTVPFNFPVELTTELFFTLA